MSRTSRASLLLAVICAGCSQQLISSPAPETTDFTSSSAVALSTSTTDAVGSSTTATATETTESADSDTNVDDEVQSTVTLSAEPATTTTSEVTRVTAITDNPSESTEPESNSGRPAPAPLQPELDYLYPIPTNVNSGYQGTHSGYAATDIFAACGAPVVSPVHGTVHDLRRSDPWDPNIDDPFSRGGKFVSILGTDGVRYYMAHFERIANDLAIGSKVIPGESLGDIGSTGRSSACHLHFAISPLCPNDEWWVRRGVIWPYPFFDAWRNGDQRSPRDEVNAWAANNPDRCLAP